MTSQKIFDEITKMEEEILKQHLDHINYEHFNLLTAHIYIVNNILPENDKLISLFAEIGITDTYIIADHLARRLRKIKGTAY